MTQAPCRVCGSPVDFDPQYAMGQEVTCSVCVDREERERLERLQAIALRNTWIKLCPPLFHDTMLDKLPYPGKTEEALSWRFWDGHGLNLWGVPNTGKTRTLFLILERLHFSGKRCRVFSPADFMAELEARNYRRAEWIRLLAKTDFLAFDDMDKLSLTAPQEKMFFALLDKRMTCKRPCLFTHNSKADQLEYNFRTGPALVRRIRQFTKSIHFP